MIRNLLMCNITLKLQKTSSKFCRIQPSFHVSVFGWNNFKNVEFYETLWQASADAATISTSHNDVDVDLNSNDFGHFQSASNSDAVATVQNTDVMLNHCDNNCDVVHDNHRNNNFNQNHKVSDTSVDSKCSRRDTISIEENEVNKCSFN